MTKLLVIFTTFFHSVYKKLMIVWLAVKKSVKSTGAFAFRYLFVVVSELILREDQLLSLSCC